MRSRGIWIRGASDSGLDDLFDDPTIEPLEDIDEGVFTEEAEVARAPPGLELHGFTPAKGLTNDGFAALSFGA